MPTSAAVLYTLIGVRSIRLMMNISDSPPQKLGCATRWQYLHTRQRRTFGMALIACPFMHLVWRKAYTPTLEAPLHILATLRPLH